MCDCSHIPTVRCRRKEYIHELRVGADPNNDADNGKNDRSVWLSTSGMGVSWLHVRIDQVPKYYTFPAVKFN